MSLSDLAALGSFVSGLAVLASLAFLYFQMRQMSAQIRQSDREQQATVRLTRADRALTISFARLDPSVALAVRNGLDGDENISAVELEQFNVYMHGFLHSLEETFNQRRAGLIGDLEYADFTELVRGTCTSTGMRIIWRTRRPRVGKEFAALIDRYVAETPLAPVRDRLVEWKTAAARVKAKATD